MCDLELVEGNKLAECREMQNSMMSILMLLEIFLRTGHRIAWEASEASYFVCISDIQSTLLVYLGNYLFILTCSFDWGRR
mgnify:FL=1